MSINNGTMNRIGAGGTLNTFGSVQTVDNTKIQELTEAIDQVTEAVQEAVQTVGDEVDNAKQEIAAVASTVVQYDVPVIYPKEDVGCVLIKNATLGDTETIEVLRPNGEVVSYTGKSIDFSQLSNTDIISDAYIPSKPYTVGKYCIYENKLYKCIKNTSAGVLPTNTTYFKETTLDLELPPFQLGIDTSGNYGYIKAGADSVTPFKNPIGSTTIVNNGTYNVTDFASAIVNVPNTIYKKTINYTVTNDNKGMWDTLVSDIPNLEGFGANSTVSLRSRLAGHAYYEYAVHPGWLNSTYVGFRGSRNSTETGGAWSAQGAYIQNTTTSGRMPHVSGVYTNNITTSVYIKYPQILGTYTAELVVTK